MYYSEMKQAVKLLANEWNLGKKECGATGNICAWIYLFTILEESEKIVSYKDGRKLVGFCGYSRNNSKKHLFKKRFYTIVKNKLYKSKNIKDLNALKQYENNYDYLPKELENYFDGEVSILLVDKNYRGKSIGKKLLLEVFNLAKKDNMKNLQILTDESCNFKFYENCGCKKIYETIVKNQEYGKLGNISIEKAFIYEKNLI
ncbi:MAG: GNAT family N-acetyltransferase [Clostridia bacterium]|nr:GNAT family N-acetyltransferase [Clostridia bacterium]